jgi:transcriptional regulator with XRE-family HTH domain
MTSETALSAWLREEMPLRGYALDGPRAGGISRLAQDTGISQATMSRVANGLQEPTVSILRKIGGLWGIPLGQMMVNSGTATAEEMVTHYGSAQLSATSGMSATAEVIPAQPADLPEGVAWPELSDLERHLWLAPAGAHLRQALVNIARAYVEEVSGGTGIDQAERRRRFV